MKTEMLSREWWLRGSTRVVLLCALVANDSCSVPRDRPCQDVGYSIASRTFSCTGDPGLANSRYERFEQDYACLPDCTQGVLLQRGYECVAAIGALSCEKVLDYAESLDRWLQVSPACGEILQHTNGMPLEYPEGGADGGGAPEGGANG